MDEVINPQWASWAALQASQALTTPARMFQNNYHEAHRATAKPFIGVNHPDFIYTPAKHTNVQNVWRKYGWVKPDQGQQARMKRWLNEGI